MLFNCREVVGKTPILSHFSTVESLFSTAYKAGEFARYKGTPSGRKGTPLKTAKSHGVLLYPEVDLLYLGEPGGAFKEADPISEGAIPIKIAAFQWGLHLWKWALLV